MNHELPASDERLVDLMIQRATFGLTESEQLEFDQLNSSSENSAEAERFELTASAIDLAFGTGQSQEEMPRQIQDKLLISAGQFLAGQRGLDSGAPIELRSALNQSNVRNSNWGRVNVAVALVTAASLLVAAGWWFLTDQGNNSPVEAVARTTQQKFDQFMSAPPSDLVELEWQPVHAPKAAGKVVWSDSRQQGYMVFKDLDVNDPLKEQYQLWIFDTAKDQTHPVDGGVFNIASTGEILVPIVAHVPVSRAVQFAITVERPGGVMVSSREKIPLLASLN